MDVASLLAELYGRVPPLARAAVDGLDATALAWAPATTANPVGWLVWHLTRVQDHHVSEVLNTGQIWLDGDRAARFGLEPDPADIGFGHTPEQVAGVRPAGADALVDYLEAVAARTRAMLADLGPADLDRVVDRTWDRPVTLGVRLTSVADDCLQHAGQAAYVRGLMRPAPR